MTLDRLAEMLVDNNYITNTKKLTVSNPPMYLDVVKITRELRESLIIKDNRHYVLVEVDK